MNRFRTIAMAMSFLFLGHVIEAQVPQILNYQGRVAVNGTNFDGTDAFQFALVDSTGAVTYWSNGNSEVSLPVSAGLYSVLLGDTTVTNMAAIPVTVFTNADVRLRVWFDGGMGLQQLSPDQRFTAVGYALMAANVPNGAITSSQLATGAVTAVAIANGAVGTGQIASGQIGSAQLAPDLSISGNFSAGSISLGGVPQTNWPIGFRSGIVLSNGVLDTSLSQFYTVTLTNHITWSFQGHSMGRVFWLNVLQGSTGGWTNSWDASVVWPYNGTIPQTTLQANYSDLFQFVDDGKFWLGNVAGLGYANSTNNYNKGNYALGFDGSQNFVKVPYSSAFYPSALTVECWFKTTGEAGTLEPIVSAFDDSAGDFEIELDSRNSRQANFYLITSSGFPQIIGGPSLDDGNWHHVALVWNSSTLTGYVDGSAVGSTATGGNLSGGHLDINIGRDSEGRYFPGVVDEVRISNVARYTNNFPPSTGFTVDANTVAYWKFNEGIGITAHDETGQHTGTLIGSPSWVAGR